MKSKRIAVIAGGTGLVGTRLQQHMINDGWQIRVLTRSPQKYEDDRVSFYYWNPQEDRIDIEALEGCDVVINLAGSGIADRRWTKSVKRKILQSRVQALRILGSALASVQGSVPGLFVSASAIGVYGHRADEIVTEESRISSEDGFLQQVCRKWESTFWEVLPDHVRGCVLRIGLVMSPNNGVFPKLAMGARWGLGVIFGRGAQELSWIHIDDLCRMIIYAIEADRDEELKVMNGTAPNPVTHREWVRAAIKAYTGRHGMVFRVPKTLIKILMGEMSDAVLMSNRVLPKAATRSGFDFKYPIIDDAMENLIE